MTLALKWLLSSIQGRVSVLTSLFFGLFELLFAHWLSGILWLTHPIDWTQVVMGTPGSRVAFDMQVLFTQ